jgi:hypothetical protein
VAPWPRFFTARQCLFAEIVLMSIFRLLVRGTMAGAIVVGGVATATAAYSVAGHDPSMSEVNFDLGMCILNHRIIYRPPSQMLAAVDAKCGQQQDAWYRACLTLRAGFSKRECMHYLAEEILRRLGG